MAVSVVADQNTTTTSTMVANFFISSLSSLFPVLLSYAIESAKLIPFLSINLTEFICASMLSTLDEILPPGRRIQTLHHYLITASNKSLSIVNYFYEFSVVKFDELFPPGERSEALWKYTDAVNKYLAIKFDEIYPPLKQYVLKKSDDSIRFSQGFCEHLVTKFHDAFPPGERSEALWKHTEAGKQYLAIKFNEIYPPLKRYILTKFDDSFPPVERAEAGKQYTKIKSEGWTIRLKEHWRNIVHRMSESLGVEEETVKLVVAACIGAWIGVFCVRLCCNGRRRRTTTKEPGEQTDSHK